MASTITHTESVGFSAPREGVGTDEHGLELVSEPGPAKINVFADYLAGKDSLQRETHWSETERAPHTSDWDDSGTSRTRSIHVSG